MIETPIWMLILQAETLGCSRSLLCIFMPTGTRGNRIECEDCLAGVFAIPARSFHRYHPECLHLVLIQHYTQ